MPKKQCECGLMIHVDNFVHKHSSQHENRMKKIQLVKNINLEPNRKGIILGPKKNELNLENYPLNDLVMFSSNSKIKSSELLKHAKEKLKLIIASTHIKTLMTSMGFELKKFRDGNYYMNVQLIKD